MFSLTVFDKDGGTRQCDLQKQEITLGRGPSSDVVLARGNVSKSHARIAWVGSELVVTDLGSTNGTFVNGKRVTEPRRVGTSDRILIGDFSIAARFQPSSECSDACDEATPPSAGQLGDTERHERFCKEIHDRLIEELDLRRLDLDRLGQQELRARAERTVRDLVDRMQQAGTLPAQVDAEQLLRDVINEALGLGPLEGLLADEEITEILVNRADQIYVERNGKLTLSEKTFSSDQAVLAVIERIVAPLGRRIDESSPLVDARLKDGSRVNAIIPPLALAGPCVTIRKFKRDALRIEDLVNHQTLTPQMADFLKTCVRARKNIVISGGTGSGKTTTLNVISSFIPSSERIVTIEDAAELQLPQEHWVRLESRPANLEGKGAITIRDLVKNCLRMRPDRIVVGECRSGEALDMLQAMNTGHDGSLTTLHANTPRDALARLETLVLMAGMDLPAKAIRDQIASAVQLIVQQSRFSDGSRKICFITEIAGMEGDVITMQDIFAFRQEGFTEDGRVRGKFVASGFVPRFYEDLRRRGVAVDTSVFQED